MLFRCFRPAPALLEPSRHGGSFIAFVDNQNVSTLVGLGVLDHTAIVLLFSLVQWMGGTVGATLVVHGSQRVTDLLELLYFNFVTILTLGYGDFTPVGVGRLLAILEACVGVALFGSRLGAVTLKLAVPSRDSVVFSKYAYYDVERECFVVQLANTHRVPMVHVQYSAALKINHLWSPEFAAIFHYQPTGAVNFKEFARRHGAALNGPAYPS